MVDTETRRQLLRERLLMYSGTKEAKLQQEPIRTVMFGHTVRKPKPNRFLGVQDLILKFDNEKRDAKGRQLGCALALVEVLVGRMLSVWVPAWVREQYERWNPFSRPCFRSALRWYKVRRDPKTKTSKPVYVDHGVAQAKKPEFLAAVSLKSESALGRAPAHDLPPREA